MNILLLGYGKMGKTIEQIALSRQHTLSAKIDIENRAGLDRISPDNTHVAIEFSQPEAAVENIKWCFENHIPVVCGTTGWLSQRASIENLCQEKNGAFFYASNYSIGVNLFFKLNKMLAKLMNGHDYEVDMTELHHIYKLDAPSGTAITIAEGVLENFSQKKQWKNEPSGNPADLFIKSLREGEAPGTHTIRYQSDSDAIVITHEAFSRQGFALGAVLAAEWLVGKTGIFGMDEMLGL